MFGYINVCKPELKIKDYMKYRAFYCGLCHKLQEKYGALGKMTLSYDMTFLIVLLTSLYEPMTDSSENRCIVHPVKKRQILVNEVTEYAADMNIVLMYYKFMDDWKDDKNPVAMAGLRSIHGSFVRIQKQYPDKCSKIRKYLARLERAEQAGVQNIDQVSGYFGRLMEELFAYKADVWEEDLRKMAFYLGKYIYILDAYDDIEEDIVKGKYNPLRQMYADCKAHENAGRTGKNCGKNTGKNTGKNIGGTSVAQEFRRRCEEILSLEMSECAMHYEKLPCVEHTDIINNIVYIGAWNKFDDTGKDDKKNCKETDC